MAQNLAIKYSPIVDEVYRKASLTNGSTVSNKDYDWDGVNSINVYGVGTMPMNNYTRSGANRYGTPSEVDTTKTSYALVRDRSFTGTIDRRNREESMNVTDAGKALRRQHDVVIAPEIDIYTLAAWSTAITANSAWVNTAATTKDTAYVDFLAANARISNLLVPIPDRTAFVTETFYSALKQSGFVVASDIAMTDRKSGDLGNVDGVDIKRVPSAYMPTNVDLIIVHKDASVQPMELKDYIIHDNPPGLNGALLEGRIVYDLFVLVNKVNALAGHKVA